MCAVTNKKREEVINKIINIIAEEFSGIDLPMSFIKRLLEDSIRELEAKCILRK